MFYNKRINRHPHIKELKGYFEMRKDLSKFSCLKLRWDMRDNLLHIYRSEQRTNFGEKVSVRLFKSFVGDKGSIEISAFYFQKADIRRIQNDLVTLNFNGFISRLAQFKCCLHGSKAILLDYNLFELHQLNTRCSILSKISNQN